MRRLTSRRVRCSSRDIGRARRAGARRPAGGARAPQRRHAPAVCSASATSRRGGRGDPRARHPHRRLRRLRAATAAARRAGRARRGLGAVGGLRSEGSRAPPASTETRYVEPREHRGTPCVHELRAIAAELGRRRPRRPAQRAGVLRGDARKRRDHSLTGAALPRCPRTTRGLVCTGGGSQETVADATLAEGSAPATRRGK
jgi:hypothetical protein